MKIVFPFIINSALLGVGLAMDAFSVSMADGLREPDMPKSRRLVTAGCFALFQFLMPMIGWTCVHTVVEYFRSFEKLIPWIALLLLGYIGGKMIMEGIRGRRNNEEGAGAALKTSGSVSAARAGKEYVSELILQGIATSIDALSVGFTIAGYGAGMAFVSSLIIGAVTFVICMAGISIGKKAGSFLAGRASILGGIILIAIGIEIFIG